MSLLAKLLGAQMLALGYRLTELYYRGKTLLVIGGTGIHILSDINC